MTSNGVKQNNIRIAIQKEGRLKSPSLSFLYSCGLEFNKENGRALIVPCANANVEILYVRHSDIPQYVENGAADFGIIGGNLLYETSFDVNPVRKDGALNPAGIILKCNPTAEQRGNISNGVKEIKKLNFGQCSLAIAVPANSFIQNIQDLEGERIATSYPNSLRKFLQREKLNAAIIEIKGSVEAMPALGLADAICDLTQTGSTLKENGLKPIATVFKSKAVLIESLFEKKKKRDFIDKFLTSIL